MDEFTRGIIDDMTWSFSRLSAFEQCPAAWKRKYLDNDDEEIGNAFADHGSFVHGLIQAEAIGDVDAYDLITMFEDGYQDAVQWRFPFRMGDAYYSGTEDFLNEYIGHEAEWPGWAVVGCEIPIEVKFGKRKVIGFIDLLLEKDGEYKVVDIKSKGKFASKRELAEYSRQLYIYAAYVKKKYKKIPTMEFFLYRGEQKHIEVPYTEDGMRGTEDWIMNTINAILEAENFEEHIDNFYCNELCDYRTSCIFSSRYIDKTEPTMRFGLRRK